VNYRNEIEKIRKKLESKGVIFETAEELKALIDKKAEIKNAPDPEKKQKTGWDIWEERLEKRLAIEIRKDNIEQIKSIPEIHFIKQNEHGIEYADSDKTGAQHNQIAYGDVLEYVSKNKVQERRSEPYKILWRDLTIR